MTRTLLILLALFPSIPALSAPIVIAHRGASGSRPEHTIPSYELAIEQGTDFIEADVVMTRDRVLVARHENEIGGTTDVAAHPEFADRKTIRTVDGTPLTGWFVEDFTLAELKTLRARERLPQLRPGNTAYDRHFTIPTLDEVIALIRDQERKRHRTIGLYVETKHPSYFRSIGLPLDEALAGQLARAGYRNKRDAVFIESFEVENLRRLRRLTKVRLVQLLDAEGGPADGAFDSYSAMVAPAGLAEIARYADAIGPAKAMILPVTAQDTLLPPTTLVADAHRAGLRVHPWTFRSENAFLPHPWRHGEDPAAPGDAAAEYQAFLSQGVDGIFSDYPGQAVAAVKASSR